MGTNFTPTDLQKAKLEKLMQNIDKPIEIPQRPKEGKFAEAPDFIRNIMGSSAGAGSGEFHVYRHLRRKEYARQRFIEEQAKKEEMDRKFKEMVETNKRKAEERSAKKRAKRLKKKERMKRAKLTRKNNPKKTDTEEDDSDSTDEEIIGPLPPTESNLNTEEIDSETKSDTHSSSDKKVEDEVNVISPMPDKTITNPKSNSDAESESDEEIIGPMPN